MPAISSTSLNFESIINAINVGLILVDRDQKVLLWNEWVARHSDIPMENALGKPLNDAFVEPPSPALLAAVRNTLQYGLPVVLSNALHRSPLALYQITDARMEENRMHQSVTITSLSGDDLQRYCLIQIADSSNSIKREKMLRSHSEVLRKEATTDSLTGLYNRRFFDEHYKMAMGQAVRQKLPISIFMVDIDYFKDYNDYYGHLAGDKTLNTVASTLKNILTRSSDVVARYGGEEFILMLPNMASDNALQFAEKLRRAIWNLAIPHIKSKIGSQLSISIGVSTFDQNSGGNERSLILAADTALYDAKHKGRNQVSCLALSSFVVPERTVATADPII